MTVYGTIPTSPSPGAASKLEYISRVKERIKAVLGSVHPWKLMFDIHFLKLQSSFAEATSRIKSYATYSRKNYAIVVLGFLFLSLFWHPVSLIVFTAAMATWLFLYFLRGEPLVVVGRTIDDRAVLDK